VSYHIGYNIKITNLENEIEELKSKIDQLKNELCPECRKAFNKIFGNKSKRG
jgi:predicted  nucleic acid-binding Zn-ribbon protein